MSNDITRFAPSPTGNLHLGGARTALINYIISKKNNNSKFYLRIEDTDKERSKAEYQDNIIESLKWLGLKWDSEPQIQSKRIDRHIEVAKHLLNNKNAYKCICDEKILQERRELLKNNKLPNKKICNGCENDKNIQNLTSEYAVRIKIPVNNSTKINDIVQGSVSVNNKEIDDYVILRKDNSPTYMLSVVVDDFDLGINFIIRGDDHLNNTFRQKYIYEFMQWDEPKYAHIPLIYGEDGTKLSKRHGAVNIIDLKKLGYLPESVINNLILLGWSPGNSKNEFINFEEILEKFEIKDFSKSASIFNYSKLNFFNNYYIRKTENLDKFLNFCKNHKVLNIYLDKDKDKILRFFDVYKKNINFYEELVNHFFIYFDINYKLDKINYAFDDIFDSNFKDFKEILLNSNFDDKEGLQSVISNFLKDKKIKFPIFGKPTRLILINKLEGPSISDILFILGKKSSMDRLNQYIVNK
tara:strand:+ start:5531 stop:6937 length:1407 start_codon:yes stop_codon:yes gene_type:complete